MDELEIVRGSDVPVREVEWLWYPYIPYGKITLVQGDPGDGKSTFVLNLAAILTSWRQLPFTDVAPEPMNVIYQNTEDDAEDTVLPRFLKAGGDPKRLCFIREGRKALTFSDDRLFRAIRQVDARVLILDPLSSYIGGDVSLNMANEVRAQFNPLIQTAKEAGCAVIVVGHMNKQRGTKALYRAIGSIDIVGAARSALLIARTGKDKPDERVMAVQKCNLAPPGPAVVFSVSDRIEWIGQTDQTADDILSGIPAPPGRPAAKAQEAEVLLQALLAEGPKPAEEVSIVLKEQGISQRTMESVKAAMGIRSDKRGSAWFWSMPQDRNKSA